MRHPRLSLFATAGPLVLSASIAANAAPPEGPRPATRSFHAALADAWALLPQKTEFAAQQAGAAARYAAGDALFPNAPSLSGTYVNDKAAGSNYNYVTTQVELSTPIWLPGEGTASQRTAQADAAAVAAALDAAHLALALQVLDAAAQAALSANARDVAVQRLKAAQALAADLGRRERVGEASESDALAADADAAAATVTLSDAQAQLGAARGQLLALTGSDALPCLDAPTPVPTPASAAGAAGVEAHPRVVAAARAVEAAHANARLVAIGNRDDPQIGLQGVDEKQPGSQWDTRFGVVLRIPFATEARNAPRRAAAELANAQAETQLALARIAVRTAIRQADVMLAGAERGREAAARAAAALDRRRGQIGRAWQLGEMPLIEVVRADALAFDADFARDKAATDLAAARLRLQIASGMLP